MSNDFKAELIAADARMPTDAQLRAMGARLDARLLQPRQPTSRLLIVAVAALSIAVGFVAVQLFAPRPPPTLGGFELSMRADPNVRVTREAAVELEADVHIADVSRGVRIESLAKSTLRRETRGIRVLSGRVRFEVDKRPLEAPAVRVLVSGGSIEVHGTRFTVIDTGLGAGSVELHEGAIDFIDDEHVTHRMVPGERLRWPMERAEPDVVLPDPPAQPSDVIKPQPAAREADWKAFDQRVHAQAVITELTSLRQKGQWDDAVRLLERELHRGAPDTRERLSFELGLIYTWQLKDSKAACAHWSQHRVDYPDGRFELEVERATQTLGCTP